MEVLKGSPPKSLNKSIPEGFGGCVGSICCWTEEDRAVFGNGTWTVGLACCIGRLEDGGAATVGVACCQIKILLEHSWDTNFKILNVHKAHFNDMKHDVYL